MTTVLAMLGGVGLPELVVIFGLLASSALLVWPAWRILSRLGLPGWMSFALLIPFVNVALLFFVAFTEWPLDRARRP